MAVFEDNMVWVQHEKKFFHPVYGQDTSFSLDTASFDDYHVINLCLLDQYEHSMENRGTKPLRSRRGLKQDHGVSSIMLCVLNPYEVVGV